MSEELDSWEQAHRSVSDKNSGEASRISTKGQKDENYQVNILLKMKTNRDKFYFIAFIISRKTFYAKVCEFLSLVFLF